MRPWLRELLAVPELAEGDAVQLGGRCYVLRGGILRAPDDRSAGQSQTGDMFGFKWRQRASFESDAWQANIRGWLRERYGDVERFLPDGPLLVLDAGCGAGVSAMHVFAPVLDRVRYLGVDVSPAVEVARERCRERGADAEVIQCDLNELPLASNAVDVIFSEGVLHHTDSTELALRNLVPLLRPGGVFMFYVYRRKGPIREFTDDYVRASLRDLSPAAAWEALMPLTKLGKALGDLDLEVDVPEDIAILGIPAGRVKLQRFLYWHVFKAFYRPDFTLEEMNHINFDWYAPANAHRQTPEEVRGWCAEAGLAIEREVVEDAGITIVARKS
jgi:SAM-dependent methyltransferase